MEQSICSWAHPRKWNTLSFCPFFLFWPESCSPQSFSSGLLEGKPGWREEHWAWSPSFIQCLLGPCASIPGPALPLTLWPCDSHFPLCLKPPSLHLHHQLVLRWTSAVVPWPSWAYDGSSHIHQIILQGLFAYYNSEIKSGCYILCYISFQYSLLTTK